MYIDSAIIVKMLIREELSDFFQKALSGIVLMVARMQLDVVLNLSFNPGDAIMLASVVFYAFYTINLHRWLGGTHPLLMLFVAAVAGSVILTPFAIAEAILVGTPSISSATIGAILFMAVVPTIIATTMWNASIGVVGPNRATIFLNLLPVFGILLGVVLLDETLYHYHIIGGLLVCVGISLTVKRH